jgi:hypothetical protein
MSVGNVVKLALGVIMFGIGVFVALRPILPNHAVLTGTRWLDMTFAAVFMLRGALNVRSVMRAVIPRER